MKIEYGNITPDDLRRGSAISYHTIKNGSGATGELLVAAALAAGVFHWVSATGNPHKALKLLGKHYLGRYDGPDDDYLAVAPEALDPDARIVLVPTLFGKFEAFWLIPAHGPQRDRERTWVTEPNPVNW